MNKKGFTLVELLAVIAILGLIIGLAVPSITTIMRKTKEKDLEDKIRLIESAAVFYAQEEITTFPSTVQIDTLITNEYLKADVANGTGNCANANGCLVNPVDNSIMNGSVIVDKINNAVISNYGES